MVPIGVALLAAAIAAGDGCLDVLWCDDFDDYALGAPLVGQDCKIAGCPDDAPGCPEGFRWAPWCATCDDTTLIVADPVRPGQALEIDAINRHPVSADDAVHEFWALDIDPTAAYRFAVDVYAPHDFVEQPPSDAYVILLNTYPEALNWSGQYHWNSATQHVISDFDGDRIPFATGEWQRMEVVIDLGADRQLMTLGGRTIDKGERGWTEGVSGGGRLDIEAVDFFANDSGVPLLFDNAQLCEIPRIGACCHDDGSCEIVLEEACAATDDGYFEGVATTCGRCPVRGADGWALEAPVVWDGSKNRALGRHDDCTSPPYAAGAVDDSFVVAIPWAQRWTFDACRADGDVRLGMGTDGARVADRRVSVASPLCAEGINAYFKAEIGAAAPTVFATIEAEEGAGGDYELSITAPCPRLEYPAGAQPEDERCGERRNDGWNMDPPMFEPIACGDTVRGWSWFDGGTRDTDWYELEIGEDTEITIVGDSVMRDFGFRICTDATRDPDACWASIVVSSDRCAGRPASVTWILRNNDRDGGDPETTRYHLFMAPSFDGPIAPCDEGYAAEPEDPGDDLPPDLDGQNGYWFTVTCRSVQCFWDVDGNGAVGFDDLVAVLANWGPCSPPLECPWDFDGDRAVGFTDVVALLAHWGPCE